MEVPLVPYNFMSVKDFLTNQSFMYEWLSAQKIICEECFYKKNNKNGFKTIRFNPTEITIKCPHKTIILYPPRADRAGAWKWTEITKEEHEKHVRNKP